MISVIVPIYNLENYIEITLKSILEQIYSDIEIIAVNDGSTDGTADLLNKISKNEPRIKVIHKKNSGVAAARLTGVAAASGEWIGFVDGDDIIEPDMYGHLLENALKYNAQISHCGYQMVFPDGRVSYFHNTGYLAQQDKITALKELLAGSRIEPGLCNKLFHKTLFHSLLHDNVLDLSIKINEDLLMNYFLFKEASNTVYEDICPYHYMVRYESASRQKLNYNKIYDPIKVKKIILDNSFNEIESDVQSAFVSTCVNTYNTLSLNGHEYSEYKRQIRKLILENSKLFKYLNKKTRLLTYMIKYIPLLYPIVYQIYVKFFQKNKYE